GPQFDLRIVQKLGERLLEHWRRGAAVKLLAEGSQPPDPRFAGVVVGRVRRLRAAAAGIAGLAIELLKPADNAGRRVDGTMAHAAEVVGGDGHLAAAEAFRVVVDDLDLQIDWSRPRHEGDLVG